jgi:cytochrome b subunit of formate dehydrogenase
MANIVPCSQILSYINIYQKYLICLIVVLVWLQKYFCVFLILFILISYNSKNIIMGLSMKNLVYILRSRKILVFSFLLILSIYTTASILFSDITKKMPEENQYCMDCHQDKTLKGMIDGKSRSVFVNAKSVLNSVHADVLCVDCHTDLKDSDLPHNEDVKPATCIQCHEDAVKDYEISLHGEALKRGEPLAPDCNFCHGSHDILPKNAKGSPIAPLEIPYLCGQCHQEGSKVSLTKNIHQTHILENYTQSIHGEGLFKKGLTVSANCASCHTAHKILPHTDNRSSIARENIAETCASCHQKIEEVHSKIIDGEKWETEEHTLPACVDCHQPHKIRKNFYDLGLANQECLNCHEKPDIVDSDDGRSLFVDAAKLKSSVHYDLACSKCHIEVTPSKKRACETITHGVNCGSCHDNVNENYMESTHGRLFSLDDPDAPSCQTCHGEHSVLSRYDKESKTFTLNIPDLCSECHRDGEKAAKRLEPKIKNVVANYTQSVHGKAISEGSLSVTANCSDCHTAHSEANHNNPTSSTHHDNISETCGQCHYGIENEFEKSIHSPNVSDTDEELPACNDCHPAHSIVDPTQGEFRFSIMSTCGQCHVDISKSYFDTYHGKASILGSDNAAKCHDCHHSHFILPVNNPQSTLSRDNILETCATCHPGANKGFTRYLTHATHHDPDKYPLLFITFWGMTFLLIGTFIISWLHTLLWLPKSLKMRKQIKAMKVAHSSGTRIRRFSPLERRLHIIMILSFLILAATGMILKFPYEGWAHFFVNLIGGVEAAGLFHRIAALMLFGVFFAHVFDLFRKKRQEFGSWKAMLFGPDSMLPNKKDWQDLKGTMKWFIGKGERPQYGRWTYWEKFDYFAVFWGVFVIGSTGLTLWFPEIFSIIFPGDLINVASIIHSDEALLAAGFIFTIHFFNTHFRPEKFPMDRVIFTGSYDIEEFKFDRPEEYRKLKEEGKLESLIVDPPNQKSKRAYTIFGWFALSFGLLLVFLIIISIIGLYF